MKALSSEDHEELRLAAVMSGGVSLAVWMGGVSLEIDRLRRKDGPYAQLLDLTQSDPQVDVIAGTSAGGLNGALLATAVAYNVSLTPLRSTWLDKGSFRALLRGPRDIDPPSLLKGDEYFLREIGAAVSDLVRDTPVDEHAADRTKLFMLTTLFEPTSVPFTDAVGRTLHDATYQGVFCFQGTDTFGDPQFPAKVALAARSSAAHPGGFEPSWVPINPDPSEASPVSDGLHPDMQTVANWKGSRYTLDGGLVMNRPLEPAVRAIYEQRASREVRRLLLFVVPDPPGPATAPEQLTMPLMQQTAAAASSIPRQQSIGDTLRRVEEHNRKVARRRDIRRDVLQGRLTAEGYEEAYFAVQGRRLAGRVLELLREVGAAPSVLGCRRDDDFENLTAVATRAIRSQNRASAWPFGDDDIDAAEGAAVALLQLLREGLRTTLEAETAEERAVLRACRELAHDILHDLRAVAEARDKAVCGAGGFVSVHSLGLESPRALAVRAATLAAVAEVPLGRIASVTEDEPAFMLAAVRRRALFRAKRRPPRGADRRDIRNDLPGLGDASADIDAAQVDAWLATFADAHMMATVLDPHDAPDQCIELVEMSANSWCAWDPRNTPAAKLTGMQFAHFGAFYKRSWRANDWMWGRLDACYHLARVMMAPDRIRRLTTAFEPAAAAAEAFAAVESIALGGGDDLRHAMQQKSAIGEAAQQELVALFAHPDTAPPSLDACAKWVAARMQLEVLQTELIEVAKAMQLDRENGNGRYPEADAFLRDIGDATTLSAVRAAELLPKCRVSDETLRSERGSDEFTRLASTAAAVAVNALSGERSGLGPLRGLIASLRGMTMALASLAGAVVNGSRVTTFLVTTIGFLTSAVLALRLSGASDVPPVFVSAALVAAAALFGFVALRRDGPIVATALGALALLAWVATALYSATQVENLTQLIVVMVAAAMLLGLTNLPGNAPTKVRSLAVAALVLCVAGAVFVIARSPIEYADGKECGPLVEFGADTKDDAKPDPTHVATCDRIEDAIVKRALVAGVGLLSLGVLFGAATKRGKRRKRRSPSATTTPASL